MTQTLKNLVGLDRAELAAEMAAFGAEPFRARQLWHWVYHRGATSFDEMTSLSKAFRATLINRYTVARPAVSRTATSLRTRMRSRSATIQRRSGSTTTDFTRCRCSRRREVCASRPDSRRPAFPERTRSPAPVPGCGRGKVAAARGSLLPKSLIWTPPRSSAGSRTTRRRCGRARAACGHARSAQSDTWCAESSSNS